MFAVDVQAKKSRTVIIAELHVIARDSSIAAANTGAIIRHPHLAACFRTEF
jgi:hypothetical protein